jgi:hypothetical protein
VQAGPRIPRPARAHRSARECSRRSRISATWWTKAPRVGRIARERNGSSVRRVIHQWQLPTDERASPNEPTIPHGCELHRFRAIVARSCSGEIRAADGSQRGAPAAAFSSAHTFTVRSFGPVLASNRCTTSQFLLQPIRVAGRRLVGLEHEPAGALPRRRRRREVLDERLPLRLRRLHAEVERKDSRHARVHDRVGSSAGRTPTSDRRKLCDLLETRPVSSPDGVVDRPAGCSKAPGRRSTPPGKSVTRPRRREEQTRSRRRVWRKPKIR